ncbi:MAG: SGNH/GDSL hydrolase family protein [Candidatus Izemoplasmatales bacterium]
MEYHSLKDTGRFLLVGSDALDEAGFRRLSIAERDRLKRENGDAAWHARSSAGIQAKFSTDARSIRVRVTLEAPASMESMSAMGQGGVDLYRFDEEDRTFRLLDVAGVPWTATAYEADLGRFADGRMRRYVLNLPLYAAAVDVDLGVDDGARIVPDAFSRHGRIAVYGTSIVQGGCVSRPGMAFTNILSRRFDREFLNFGFSGAAYCERTTAAILGSRRGLSLLAIDAEANAGTSNLLAERLPDFIAEFRLAYPTLPILLVSRPAFAMDQYDADRIRHRSFYDGWFRTWCQAEQGNGRRVAYLDGSVFYEGNDAEATVDGIHPSDLGHARIADAYERAIRHLLGAE